MPENLPASLPKVDCVEFRHIVGFPGYAVGDDGSVWSCRGSGFYVGRFFDWRKLKTSQIKGGYLVAALGLGGRGIRRCRIVHRIVLETFVGPCPKGMEGCHNNSNPKDNRLCNLRWDTPKNNYADARRRGSNSCGSRSGAAKIDENMVKKMREMYSRGIMPAKIQKITGVLSESTIRGIVRRKYWTHVA